MWKKVIVKYASNITVPSAVQHMEVVNFSVKARAFLVFSTEGASEIRGIALRVRSCHLDHTWGSTRVLACMQYYIKLQS